MAGVEVGELVGELCVARVGDGLRRCGPAEEHREHREEEDLEDDDGEKHFAFPSP